jgi:hypothetical protein
VAPPSAASRTCSARRAKSAAKIEDASSINVSQPGFGRVNLCGNLTTDASPIFPKNEPFGPKE